MALHEHDEAQNSILLAHWIAVNVQGKCSATTAATYYATVVQNKWKKYFMTLDLIKKIHGHLVYIQVQGLLQVVPSGKWHMEIVTNLLATM